MIKSRFLHPDQLYIDRIREHLWRPKSHGKAAVMIGAGMSLNAFPRSPATGPFPTWDELTGYLVSKLYSHKNGEPGKNWAISDLLRLAEEYVAAYDLGALERLLKHYVPDEDYEAGPLHERLLSLRWADVFTTNWDTLLERCVKTGNIRGYGVVRSVKGIPLIPQPRIIKLHGSFPDNGPFIFTEEQYRQYPKTHAPFVNMVQQSIMENIFVLIGFSGDDPNFLHWTGWVRDNLGDSRPPIYLCTFENITKSKRKLLEVRKVIPIDLGTVFDHTEKDWKNKALEWFLVNLEAGQGPDLLKWPSRECRKPKEPYFDLSEAKYQILDAEGCSIWGEHPPHTKTPSERTFQEWVSIIDEFRRSYPGWVVAPYENRSSLRIETWGYSGRDFFLDLPRISENDDLALTGQLRILADANWILERCGLPLTKELGEIIEKSLTQCTPYKTLAEEPCFDTEAYRQFSNSKTPDQVRKDWNELALAILQYYLEGHGEEASENYSNWRKRLKLVFSGDDLAALCYLECQRLLTLWDDDACKEELLTWPNDVQDAFWLARKGVVLNQVGDMDEADRTFVEALNHLSRGNISDSQPFYELSREIWSLYLWSTLDWKRQQEARDRIGQLSYCGIDPWNEVSRVEASLGDNKINKYEEETSIFDPGYRKQETKTNHKSLGPEIYQALRFCKDAALPYSMHNKSHNVLISSNIRKESIQLIEPVNPEKGLFERLSCRNVNVLKVGLPRGRVAALSDDIINLLTNMGLQAYRRGVKGISSQPPNNYWHNIEWLRLGIELLSRMAQCLPLQEVSELLKETLVSWDNKQMRNDIRIPSDFGILIRRLITALPYKELRVHLPRLIEIPMPENREWDVNPIRYIPEPKPKIFGERKKDDDLTEPIKKLLSDLRSESGKKRDSAVLWLHWLYRAELLLASEQNTLTEGIWAVRDDNNLPVLDDVYSWILLQLPEQKEGETVDIIRRTASNFKLPDLYDYEGGRKIFRSGKDHNGSLVTLFNSSRPFSESAIQNGSWVDWKEDEARSILKGCQNWWEREGKRLFTEKSSRISFYNELEDRIYWIIKVLIRVVVPTLPPTSNAVQDLVTFVEALKEAGVNTLMIETFLLRFEPTKVYEVASRICRDALSIDYERIELAAETTVHWSSSQHQIDLPLVPDEVLNAFAGAVVARKAIGLSLALWCLTQIVTSKKELLPKPWIDLTMKGLEFLREETRYKDLAGDAPTVIAVEDFPEIRKRCTALAVALAKKGFKEATVNSWIDDAQNDRLPEVRETVTDFTQ